MKEKKPIKKLSAWIYGSKDNIQLKDAHTNRGEIYPNTYIVMNQSRFGTESVLLYVSLYMLYLETVLNFKEV